MKTTGH